MDFCKGSDFWHAEEKRASLTSQLTPSSGVNQLLIKGKARKEEEGTQSARLKTKLRIISYMYF